MKLITAAYLVVSCLLSLASGDLQSVNYTHDGVDLQGFMAIPENSTSPLPVLVILPDWKNGVNEYEKQRAEFVAGNLRYVAFAADIYGKDLHLVDNITERSALASRYRSNAMLFSRRIQAAVDTVRTLDMVDGDNIALVGYCFGRTGALTYAMTGVNDVTAVVFFHGGLSSVPDTADVNVTPKVLVLSGGSDDAASEIAVLEKNLDSVNAYWEISRYSNIEHAFTVWDDERYNEWADSRSWESMKEFLKEAFGEITYQSNQPEGIDVTDVEYEGVDGTLLKGYLAVPSDECIRPLPAVVIVHDGNGNNQYEKERATLLAQN